MSFFSHLAIHQFFANFSEVIILVFMMKLLLHCFYLLANKKFFLLFKVIATLKSSLLFQHFSFVNKNFINMRYTFTAIKSFENFLSVSDFNIKVRSYKVGQ